MRYFMSEVNVVNISIAEESDRIKRAREKLQSRLLLENEKINPESLNCTIHKIQDQIHRNLSFRSHKISDKPLSLFAEGIGTEEMSAKVKVVLERLRAELIESKVK